MDNPLELPAPQDPLERIHAFARDIAYGVAHGLWGTSFSVSKGGSREEWNAQVDYTGFVRVITAKWGDDPLRFIDLLLSFGYMRLHKELQYSALYLLTEKAFALLEKPLGFTSVFVSYRRSDSSPLALLVEARLRLADHEIDVFVDKDIPIGQGWEQTLRDKVSGARYFVALIGAHTLQSPHVCDEIEWAITANTTIITVLHPGLTFDSLAALPDLDPRAPALIAHLHRLQSIPIKSQSAEDYDAAIRKLLNAMGYMTL